MNEPQPKPEPQQTVLATVIGDALPKTSAASSARTSCCSRSARGDSASSTWPSRRQPVRRRVALKIIKPGMDTAQVIARFESERQALALMDHPNIARVLDAGATASGHPYFVMELVKGVPITEFCDKNHLPPEARLKLFVDVCHAIQHAHHKGIIHRDIKPSNVMVTLHDGVPVVKVIDFGVAKATVQKLTERTLFTAYGQMLGTPAYMSPEQAEMSGLDIDTRSDVYSLGVLLYELLTGTTPLEARAVARGGICRDAAADPRGRAAAAEHAIVVVGRLGHGVGGQPRSGRQAAGAAPVGRPRLGGDEGARKGPQPALRHARQLRGRHRALLAARGRSWPGRLRRAYRLKKFAQRNRGGRVDGGGRGAGPSGGNGSLHVAGHAGHAGRKTRDRVGPPARCEEPRAGGGQSRAAKARDRAERRVHLALDAVQSFARPSTAIWMSATVRRTRPCGRRCCSRRSRFTRDSATIFATATRVAPRRAGSFADAYFKLADLTGDIGSLTSALASATSRCALEPLAKEARNRSALRPGRSWRRPSTGVVSCRGRAKAWPTRRWIPSTAPAALLEALIQERSSQLNLA